MKDDAEIEFIAGVSFYATFVSLGVGLLYLFATFGVLSTLRGSFLVALAAILVGVVLFAVALFMHHVAQGAYAATFYALRWYYHKSERADRDHR